MIRSAYDLFRFDLLKALKQKMPKDLDEEKKQWRTICEFMNIGMYNGPIVLDYEFKEEQLK